MNFKSQMKVSGWTVASLVIGALFGALCYLTSGPVTPSLGYYPFTRLEEAIVVACFAALMMAAAIPGLLAILTGATRLWYLITAPKTAA